MKLPEELVKLDRLPEDPEGMDMYGFQGPEAAGIVKVWTENLCGEIFDRESIINAEFNLTVQQHYRM